MIVVRDIFRLKFGAAKPVRALLEEGRAINDRTGYGLGRALTDFTGASYRLILEASFESLADYEARLTSSMATPEWQAWYQNVIPYIESSEREILRVID